MLNASKVKSTSTKKRAPALPPGTYPVRLVQVISLGTQEQRTFPGDDRVKPPVPELWVTYEFLDEFMKDEEGNELKDKPRWLSESIPLFSLRSERAKSTQRYLALDPTETHSGDWAKLPGAPAMLTLVNTPSKKDAGVIYENVDGLSAMRPKEVDRAPELVNPTKVFDFDAPDMDVFFSLPDFLQDRIKEAVDYPGSKLEKLVKTTKPAKEAVASATTPADKGSEEPAEDEADW